MTSFKSLYLPLLILPVFIFGCSGSSSAVNQGVAVPLPAKITIESVPMILDPLKVPDPPDPALNDATIPGVDSNNNGIRDDAERWIAQTYPTSARMRAAMAQMALSLQTRIATRDMTSEQAYQMGVGTGDAVACLIRTSESTGLPDNLKQSMAEMLNTRPRMVAYQSFLNTLGSRLFKSPDNNACDVNQFQLPN